MLAQAVLAWALTMSLYALGLAVSPPHLTHDEIKFALQAKSIADTGRDINGRFLPLYFVEPGFSVGRDPICIYVMAAVLRVLPLSEISIRLSTVLVGAIGVGLTFVLAALLFQRSSIAWAAAALVALTPTYYIHSRLALSVIYPVPFTLAWLVALVLYLSRGQVRYAVACGVILGLGVYSYLAAAIMMPLYLVATVVTLLVRGDRRGVAAARLLAVDGARSLREYPQRLSTVRPAAADPGAEAARARERVEPEGAP
jgi:4-amino-4-deoxy-L-arabinose transferase-like glycosyltransferase